MRRWVREIGNAVLLTGALAVAVVGAGVAIGQTTTKADQGKPGNQGPWPVTCVSGCSGGGGSSGGGTVTVDGGLVTVNQGLGNDGGIFWNTRESWKSVLVPVTSAVSCATTATAAPTSIMTGRVSTCFINNSSVPIFIGGASVTTANGFPLGAGAALCDNTLNAAYFCIVATGTADLRVLEN